MNDANPPLSPESPLDATPFPSGVLSRLEVARAAWVSAHRKMGVAEKEEASAAEDAYYAADRAYTRELYLWENSLMVAARQTAALLTERTELKAEVERLRAARSWQPIESAPQDGTMIVLWSGGPRMAFWRIDVAGEGYWDDRGHEVMRPTAWAWIDDLSPVGPAPSREDNPVAAADQEVRS